MSLIKTRNDEIEKKNESHIFGVIEMVKIIGTQAIRNFRIAEREEINKIDKFKKNIDKEVNKLQLNQTFYFSNPYLRVTIRRNFKKLPIGIHYKLNEFNPGRINKLIQKELSDIVKKTENSTEIYKRTNKKD